VSQPNDKPLVGARGIVLHRGHVMLLRGEEPGRVYYFLPGGMVRHGETLQAACEREVFEETGVRVHARRLLYVREFIAERHKRRTAGMPANHHVIAGVFLCEVTGSSAEKPPSSLGKFTADHGAGGVTGLFWLPQTQIAGVDLHPPQLKEALTAEFPPPIDAGVQFWPED
jgi:ADP-ribose pyrophosphatase YjhB (NUDIX family)